VPPPTTGGYVQIRRARAGLSEKAVCRIIRGLSGVKGAGQVNNMRNSGIVVTSWQYLRGIDHVSYRSLSFKWWCGNGLTLVTLLLLAGCGAMPRSAGDSKPAETVGPYRAPDAYSSQVYQFCSARLPGNVAGSRHRRRVICRRHWLRTIPGLPSGRCRSPCMQRQRQRAKGR